MTCLAVSSANVASIHALWLMLLLYYLLKAPSLNAQLLALLCEHAVLHMLIDATWPKH